MSSFIIQHQAAGDNSAGQCDVSAWRDIADIAAYDDMTVGLSATGEAFIAGVTGSSQTSAATDAVADNAYVVEDTDIQENVFESDSDVYEDILDIFKPPANTDIQVKFFETINDSWEEIIANINNGTYADRYHIGDTKALDLGAEGIIKMQIVAFNADELAGGEGKAAITWISKQLLKTPHRINPLSRRDAEETIVQGSWGKSEMRKYLNETIKPLIPETVRNAIKPVRKYSKACKHIGSEVTNSLTTDDLWIPSYCEVFGVGLETHGPIYSAAFSNNDSRIKSRADGSAAWWWLRSAYGKYGFYYVYTDGSYYSYNAYFTGGVALGFCT